MGRTARTYSVVRIHDGKMETERMTHEHLSKWASSDEYNEADLVFVGDSVSLHVETVTTVSIGAPKTRKPRAKKVAPPVVADKKRGAKAKEAEANGAHVATLNPAPKITHTAI